MAGAFTHGMNLFAMPVDGPATIAAAGKSSRSRSPGSTCAGSADSSPDRLHCECSESSFGVSPFELLWLADQGPAAAPIEPPPGLERCAPGAAPPRSPWLPHAGPRTAAPAPPPGLCRPDAAPPAWEPRVVPPAPAHWAPPALPAAGAPPPPPPALAAFLPPARVPPPPAAPAGVCAPPPRVPQPPPGRSPRGAAAAGTAALDFPSAGSANHRFGMCKPCAFFHNKGCDNGRDCDFCHLCGPKEMASRKKEKKFQRLAAQGHARAPPRAGARRS